jgi:hypothetical protein
MVPVRSHQTGAPVEVGDVMGVRGNTEVYSMGRTSGYSLGITSEVPGFQRFGEQWTREWTVRQHAPVNSRGERPSRRRRQAARQW